MPEDVASKWEIISNFGMFIRRLYNCRHRYLENSMLMLLLQLKDDGRATNPSSTQEAIAQVRRYFPAASDNTLPLGIIV